MSAPGGLVSPCLNEPVTKPSLQATQVPVSFRVTSPTTTPECPAFFLIQNLEEAVSSPSVRFGSLNKDELSPRDSVQNLCFSAAIGIEKTKSCAVICPS